jgi:hypothetical protein
MKNIETETATLHAMESIVKRHEADTKKIMESNDENALLKMALSDAMTAKALFAYDPKGLSEAVMKYSEENNDEDNLLDTVKSLIELGEKDQVIQALKNVVLGAVQKSTGAKPVATSGPSAKIMAGQNRTPMSLNGQKIKRSPLKAFNNVVNKPQADFNRIVADSVNINASATSILKEAMARKAADGRLVNTTRAAATIATHTTTGEKGMNNKFTDDDNLWTSYVKQNASIEMQKNVANATVYSTKLPTDDTAMRWMSNVSDVQSRLPAEFAPKIEKTMDASFAAQSGRMRDAANRAQDSLMIKPNHEKSNIKTNVTDRVGVHGGEINQNIPYVDGMTQTELPQPADVFRDQAKKTLPQYRNGKANNGEPQQFPYDPTGDTGSNIESGRGYY